MEITGINHTSLHVYVELEYLGESIEASWCTSLGWEIDQTIDHYGWDEDEINECFELLQELPTPRVVLE